MTARTGIALLAGCACVLTLTLTPQVRADDTTALSVQSLLSKLRFHTASQEKAATALQDAAEKLDLNPIVKESVANNEKLRAAEQAMFEAYLSTAVEHTVVTALLPASKHTGIDAAIGEAKKLSVFPVTSAYVADARRIRDSLLGYEAAMRRHDADRRFAALDNRLKPAQLTTACDAKLANLCAVPLAQRKPQLQLPAGQSCIPGTCTSVENSCMEVIKVAEPYCASNHAALNTVADRITTLHQAIDTAREAAAAAGGQLQEAKKAIQEKRSADVLKTVEEALEALSDSPAVAEGAKIELLLTALGARAPGDDTPAAARIGNTVINAIRQFEGHEADTFVDGKSKRSLELEIALREQAWEVAKVDLAFSIKELALQRAKRTALLEYGVALARIDQVKKDLDGGAQWYTKVGRTAAVGELVARKKTSLAQKRGLFDLVELAGQIRGWPLAAKELEGAVSQLKRERAVAKSAAAIAVWEKAIKTPIAALEAYYKSGIKGDVLKDLLQLLALGLIAEKA